MEQDQRYKGECGRTPRVGKEGDPKPYTNRVCPISRGLGRGLGRGFGRGLGLRHNGFYL